MSNNLTQVRAQIYQNGLNTLLSMLRSDAKCINEAMIEEHRAMKVEPEIITALVKQAEHSHALMLPLDKRVSVPAPDALWFNVSAHAGALWQYSVIGSSISEIKMRIRNGTFNIVNPILSGARECTCEATGLLIDGPCGGRPEMRQIASWAEAKHSDMFAKYEIMDIVDSSLSEMDGYQIVGREVPINLIRGAVTATSTIYSMCVTALSCARTELHEPAMKTLHLLAQANGISELTRCIKDGNVEIESRVKLQKDGLIHAKNAALN